MSQVLMERPSIHKQIKIEIDDEKSESDFKTTLLPQPSHKSFPEGIYLLFFAIGNILGGLVSFEIKYLKILFPDEYDAYHMNLWRSIIIASIVWLYMRYKKVDLIDPRTIKNQFWFHARTTGQFFNFITFVYSLQYIRVGTSTLILAMNPVLVVVFACFVLNEVFYLRYIIGIGVCFVGSFIIVMNDSRAKPHISTPEIHDEHAEHGSLEEIETSLNTIIGVTWAILGLICSAMLVISSKVLMREKIHLENQIFYLCIVNAFLSAVFIFFFSSIKFSYGFMIGSFINGFTFLASTVFIIEAIRGVDVNKTTPLSYCGTLVVFLISVVFIGESIYLTDFIGCGIIVGYNIFNMLNPIKK
jgi:drug/metabolite transporter (DMT)-like permease